jgi:imidazolonepropionase-like amidohydrolase
MDRGERVGAELQLCGPIFAGGTAALSAPSAGGTAAPALGAQPQLFRSPTTAAEGAEQVQELANRGLSALRVLPASAPGGSGGLEPSVMKAVVDSARQGGLPVIVHTTDARGIEAALAAGASGVDYGSFRDPLPPALLRRMARAGVTYNPALSSLEALAQIGEGKG